MGKKLKYIFFILLALGAILTGWLFVQHQSIAVLNPKGWVAFKQRDLFVIAMLLMLIVVIPVFVMTVTIAWKYRASNKKAKYHPEWDNSHVAETIWWGVPCLIIIALGIITWKSSHELDPYKPLNTEVKPITIQVVALQWKWLFIYPEEKIASVNFFQFPEKTPVHFKITADAPMNSFWIPELGGQIFAMSGMQTELHLIADQNGEFRGSSANISGAGFSGMHFMAKASSPHDFNSWVDSVKQQGSLLNENTYNKLAEPSKNAPVSVYRVEDASLFDQIIMKYMTPMHMLHESHTN